MKRTGDNRITAREATALATSSTDKESARKLKRIYEKIREAAARNKSDDRNSIELKSMAMLCQSSVVDQAVIAELEKHGYKVENHYQQGSDPGHYAPGGDRAHICTTITWPKASE